MPDKYYTKIKDDLIRSGKLTPNEKTVLFVLLSYGDCEEIFVKQERIAKEANTSKATVKRAIKKLKELKMISVKITPDRATAIYKLLTGAVGSQRDNGGVTESPGSGHTDPTVGSHRATEYNKISNKSIDKEIPPTDNIPYKEIIEHLISVSGKNFKHTSKATRKFISGRWNEGYRLPDFIKVIDNYDKRFKGTEFHKYLQPSTLFNGKFDERLHWEIEQLKESQRPRGRIIE